MYEKRVYTPKYKDLLHLFDQIIETVHIINQKKFNGIIPNLHPLKLLNRSPLSFLFLSILSYTMF